MIPANPILSGEFIVRWICMSERRRPVFNGWPVALKLGGGTVGACSTLVCIEDCTDDGDDAIPFNLIPSSPLNCDSFLILSIDFLINGIALKLFVCS